MKGLAKGRCIRGQSLIDVTTVVAFTGYLHYGTVRNGGSKSDDRMRRVQDSGKVMLAGRWALICACRFSEGVVKLPVLQVKRTVFILHCRSGDHVFG